ncbi:MAG: hypothetical protein KGO05_03750, partial [Chloroflexota bacterium]|nr:hypothetical protein [Chloroflexota bacterium]
GVSSSALSAGVGTLTLCLLIALLVGALAYQIVARRWPNGELAREQTVQERLIITPDGLVYHLLTGRGSRLTQRMILGSPAPEDPIGGVAHGCLAFAWIATIEGRSTWSGVRTMRIGLRDGAIITLPLLSLGASAELALETAREALRGWRERGTVTGAGSAVTDV